jgi:hypothetical protein
MCYWRNEDVQSKVWQYGTTFAASTSTRPEVGKIDDIKSVNYIFGNPVPSWKEVWRVEWCMKCEKSNILF